MNFQHLKSLWLLHFSNEDRLIRETLGMGLTEAQADELIAAIERHPHAQLGERVEECLHVLKRFQ